MSGADGSAGPNSFGGTDGDGDHRLVVDDLTVSLGDAEVLDGVTTRVAPGEFVGLVGPNGAGKTTLLRAASGYLTPAAGTVRVGGDDLHALSSRAASRRVATVPQETGVAFEFSVRDVVAMGRTPHLSRFGGADETDRRAVDRALARTATADLADRPVTELSGGERGRVLLARALAQDAPVLLLDEPTASLDVNHQVETLGLVRELADASHAVVAAVHDLDLAARFCDRLVLLADGGVVADDDPAAVLTADGLGDAFDADAVVGTDPITSSPRVTAFPKRTVGAEDGPAVDADSVDDSALADTTVHVVAGGGVAGPVLRRLAAAGADLSVGAVPAGDADAATARAVGADVVTVPPLLGVDDATAERVRRRVGAADATVLALAAPGPGQRPNLRAATAADAVVAVDLDGAGPEGDETDDPPTAYRRLRRRGRVTTPAGVVDALAEAVARASPSEAGAAARFREDD
ncbi:MAG: ATP-binding cassette domain-containing protein [Halolamina sp.]